MHGYGSVVVTDPVCARSNNEIQKPPSCHLSGLASNLKARSVQGYGSMAVTAPNVRALTATDKNFLSYHLENFYFLNHLHGHVRYKHFYPNV